MEQETSVSGLLALWGQGNPEALDRLAPIVYDELRRLASHSLRRERPGHTLQSTALVNEAFLRLIGPEPVTFEGRAHFFGIASRLIRQILVDHARRRDAAKRGSGALRLELNEAIGIPSRAGLDLVELNLALDELAALDPRQARIVELRFFAGLGEAEVAALEGVTERTIRREWVTARAWLLERLTPA